MTTTIDNEQKTLNVPNLRFPEFEGEWQDTRLKEISKFSKERLNSIELSCSNYVTTENMLQDYKGIVSATNLPTNTNVIKFSKGDVLLSNIRPYLKKVWYADRNGGCSADVFVFKALPICNSNFLHHVIANDRFIKFVMGGAKGVKMPRGDKEQMITYKVGLPCIEEQKKIATLLSLLDERISTQNKIIEKLESLIKGISNRLLYADNSMSIRIEEMLIERSERTKKNNQYEILSSTVNGIFSQRDYFSKDIASDNNVGYKIIHLHDIVLSPQNLWMGNINFNDKFDIGIVSPSYKVFSIADGFDKKYVAALLKTHHALYNYMLVSEQGASIVRRNLNYEAFEQLVFKIPSLNKQQEIGHVISLLKSQLENANLLIKTYNSQKQYLLRQMFI